MKRRGRDVQIKAREMVQSADAHVLLVGDTNLILGRHIILEHCQKQPQAAYNTPLWFKKWKEEARKEEAQESKVIDYMHNGMFCFGFLCLNFEPYLQVFGAYSWLCTVGRFRGIYWVPADQTWDTMCKANNLLIIQHLWLHRSHKIMSTGHKTDLQHSKITNKQKT